MISTNDFVSTDEIIAEVTSTIMDDEFKYNGRSYYMMLVHRAVEALAIQSYYQLVTKDIFNWNCNDNFMFEIPSNAFNLREMIFFNLTCGFNSNEGEFLNPIEFTPPTPPPPCSCTSEQTSKDCWGEYAIAHVKTHYNSFGSTEIRTAKISNKGGPHDPVYQNFNRFRSGNHFTPRHLIYVGIQNGVYTACNEAGMYKHVRLVYNGLGSENDKLPCIPRIFREAIVDKCVVSACARLKVKYPNYRVIWQDSLAKLEGQGRVMGTWQRAKDLAKKSDKKVTNDYQEYLANPTLK